MLALSPRPEVVRRCCLLWGVRGELNQEPEGTTALIEACAAAAAAASDSRARATRSGSRRACRRTRAGGTNLFKVHRLE